MEHSSGHKSWLARLLRPESGVAILVQSVVVVAVLWVIVSRSSIQYAVPPPTEVVAATYHLFVSLAWVPHAIATLKRVLMAFVVATVLATTFASVMGLTDFVSEVMKYYLVVAVSVPAILVAVFATMWFGVSDFTPAAAAISLSFPFFTLYLYEGVKDIDNDLVQMSRAFEVPRTWVVRKVIIKSVLPNFFAGARLSFADCWKLVTLGELFAAQSGLGFMIKRQMTAVSLTGVIAWALIFTAIMVAVEYGIFREVERRMFDWRDETTSFV